MRSSTPMVLAARNVGDSKDSETVWGPLPFTELVLKLAEWLATRSMASRIDLVLARSEEEARNALRVRGRENSHTMAVNQDLVSSLQAMMDEAEENHGAAA